MFSRISYTEPLCHFMTACIAMHLESMNCNVQKIMSVSLASSLIYRFQVNNLHNITDNIYTLGHKRGFLDQ